MDDNVYLGQIGMNTIACPKCGVMQHGELVGHGTLFIPVSNTQYAEMRSKRGGRFEFVAECHHLKHRVTVKMEF